MRMKQWLVLMLAAVLAISCVPPKQAAAQAQQGGPFVLNPARTIDNLEMLPAAAAERNDEITIFNAGEPKYFWINNFGARSNDYLKWTVRSDLSATTDYFAWLHISANAGTVFKLTVTQDATTTETTFTKVHGGWEVADVGILRLPAGESSITLTKVTSGNQNIMIKGLDMIRDSDKAAYLERVAAYKAQGAEQLSEFSNSGYGLFFQYGTWGFPQFGAKKNAEDSTNDFDVEAFVDLLEDTGSKFVIWSITWWQYRMQMPVRAVDDIMDDSSLTTERNLIGEIAAAAKQRGIDFYLYYHQGIQQEPAWRAKQNWPSTFTNYGTGDRSTFFHNWENVVAEIGTTLGTNLDGWFFDDGCVYYPASFERLALATKAGNPKRLVSYNAWSGTKITEFQDMIFGEGTWGEVTEPTVDGIFQSGREAGLLQVGMPMLNNGNWGVTSQNEPIELAVNAGTLIANVTSASERKVPMALNIKMWEGGTIGDSTVQALFALKNAMESGEQPQPETLVNDNDPRIRYSESTGWTYGPNDYSGYYNRDTHYSRNPGSSPSAEFEFTGTGIGVIGKRASWSTNFDVYIDEDIDTGTVTGSGVFQGTPETNQYEAYSKKDLPYGSHKIKVVFKAGAQEAHLDAFKVYDSSVQLPEEPDYPVKSLLVTSESSAMGLSATMQMSASIIPQYASDKSIDWSVAGVDGEETHLASIDAGGMLTSGQWPGTVKVIARSKANPAISAEKAVNIQVMPKVTTVYGDDPGIVKTGEWTTRSGSRSVDSTEALASATYAFTGNYIEWYGVAANDHGIADIYIDDEYVTNVDLYSAGRETGKLLYRSEDLGGGPHTITIRVQSSKNQFSSNTYVEIYSFKIEEPAVESEAPRIRLSGPATAGFGGGYKATLGVELPEGAADAIFAQELTVAYDPAVFEFDNIANVKEGLNATVSETSAGTIHLLIASLGEGNEIVADADILDLMFTVRSVRAESSRLAITRAVVSDGDGVETTVEPSVLDIAILNADLNGDGQISIGDLGIVARHYGKLVSTNPESAIADVNLDGKVDLEDLILVANGLLSRSESLPD